MAPVSAVVKIPMRRGFGKETSFDCQNNTLDLHSFNLLVLLAFVISRDSEARRYGSCLKKLDVSWVVFIFSELLGSGVLFRVLQSLQGQRRVGSSTQSMEENGRFCEVLNWTQQHTLCMLNRPWSRSFNP